MQINQTLSATKLNECHPISTFGNYKIYQADEDVQYLFAIDNNILICSCFEFVEYEDYVQLAHMYTVDSLKGQGIGKQILREAVGIYNTFALPSRNTNHTYYFIEDGLGWIEHCFDMGILTYPSFRRP
jgi:GNAT superfamily N-acetyltransferase